MLYRNFTNSPKWLVVGSVKRKIKAGEAVNVSLTDLNHSGSNVRFFELVTAQDLAEERKFISPDEAPEENVELTKQIDAEGGESEQLSAEDDAPSEDDIYKTKKESLTPEENLNSEERVFN